MAITRRADETVLLEGVMKDPIILCPLCGVQARKKRHRTGYRCTGTGCPRYEDMVASESDVLGLKCHLLTEARQNLFEWAKGCQTHPTKGPLKCLPPYSDLTSTARAIDAELVI